MFKNRKDKNTHGYRVIKTARTLAQINEAVGAGYTPIIREITEPDVTFTYYRVVQNKTTREISVDKDAEYGMGWFDPDHEYRTALGSTGYYPKVVELPFAAYLVPPDAQPEEMFYAEDLIEDYIGLYHNRGYFRRLNGCEAKWDGKDLIIQYEKGAKMAIMMG